MFKEVWLQTYKPSWRTRIAAFWSKLTGRHYIGIDYAKEGSETTVEGYRLNGKFYVTKITHH